MKRAMLAAIGLLSLSVFVLAAAAAGGTTRYVSPSGVDNPTCSKNSPCKHIQQAVDVASAGDTISLAKGNYVEQVSIAKDLTLTGAGSGASTISAPAVALVPDSHGFLNIVEINSGASVRMSQLAVAGPGPGTCDSIDRGISVIDGASLAITRAAVSDIRDNPRSECNNGFDVGAGTQIARSTPPDPEVGHLTIDHTTLTGYQRAAIFVVNDGSTGQIDHNTIKGTPCTVPVTAPAESGCSSVVRRPSITTRSAATSATTRPCVRPGLVQRLSVVRRSHDRGCLVDCDLTQQPVHERRRHLHRHRGHDRPQRRGLPLVRHRHRLSGTRRRSITTRRPAASTGSTSSAEPAPSATTRRAAARAPISGGTAPARPASATTAAVRHRPAKRSGTATSCRRTPTQRRRVPPCESRGSAVVWQVIGKYSSARARTDHGRESRIVT